MKRTLALILTVMMVFCMIPASLLSALANGPGVGVTSPDNLSLQAGKNTAIPETVNVDGVLGDTGWDKDSWVTVSSATGNWNVGTPRNDDFAYGYQLHRNETFFYGAYSISMNSIFKGELSEIVVWINDGSAKHYTQKIVISDISFADDKATTGTATMTAYNGTTVVTDPTSLSGETPVAKDDYYTVSDSSRVAVGRIERDGRDMVEVEFRFRMDNFGEDFRKVEKLTSFSQVTLKDGDYSESIYFPRLATSEDRIMTDSPDAFWPDDAHEITQSDILNNDGTADYNNVLPTDINIDGRFTEGAWVNFTGRYTALNSDGIGYTIDDYRREESYDNGYVTGLDIAYSNYIGTPSNTAGTNYGGATDAWLEFGYKALRFKYTAGLDYVDGNYYLTGAVVAFADSRYYEGRDIYCYVVLQSDGGTDRGMLKIKLDHNLVVAEAEQQFYSSFYGAGAVGTSGGGEPLEHYMDKWGGARRQTYTRYLVNFEFSIPLIDKTAWGDQINLNTNFLQKSDRRVLIEVSDKNYDMSKSGSGTIRESRRGGYWANSNWIGASKLTHTRNYNDRNPDGDLQRDTWQCLIGADPYIDGSSAYKGGGSVHNTNHMRTDLRYLYEVYADYDYLYGAVLINDVNGGWNTGANAADSEAFTLWVYNNTVTERQHYNFAISFYNTADSTGTYNGDKTSWQVSAWYKNAPSNSPLASADPNAANTYKKGDDAIAGIEAVMRKLSETDGIYKNYGGDAFVLEFKIPTSLLYYDQSWGADPFSNAISFGYYTSISKGGVASLDGNSNFTTAIIAHPMPNNHGAGLDYVWETSDPWTELKEYTPIWPQNSDNYVDLFLPNGKYWGGAKDGVGTLCYEVNDRVFDPKRVYSYTSRQIRGDDSNDGWTQGRVIDNFRPDAQLEEVFWNQDDELITVNGATGYWANLPSGSNEFDYRYRVYTGREYVYGGIKFYADGIEPLIHLDNLEGEDREKAIAENSVILNKNAELLNNTKFTIWFNSNGGNSATHRFTFWLENSIIARCEGVNLITGLDIPLQGAVLEEGNNTSGTIEEYVVYDVKTINNQIVVEFMIDMDLLNLNNTKDNASHQYPDTARDGYEYVVGVTHPTDVETLTLYHTNNNEKTFWMTGFGDETYGAGAGMVVTELKDGINVGTDSVLVVFEPTEYDDVYKITKRLEANARQGADLKAVLSGNGVSLAEGAFVYVFNSGSASDNGVADSTSSYATDRGLANLADFAVNSLIKFENLVLDNNSLAYTKNEATYTYCGLGNYSNITQKVEGLDNNDTWASGKDGKTDRYYVSDHEPNANHKNAHLEQNDTGYISVPQYSIFTENTNDILASDPENGWVTASPAYEVTYLNDYILEKVYVDGLLDDQGWVTANWISVNEDVNGNRQTEDHTSGKASEFMIYEYAVRNDGEYFYVAAKIYMPFDGVYKDGTALKDDAGGKVYPTFRLWTNDGTTSTFTKLFDLEAIPGTPGSGSHSYQTTTFAETKFDTRTIYNAADFKSANAVANGKILTENADIVSDGNGKYTILYGGAQQTNANRGNYNVRVAQIDDYYKHNPNAGSADGRNKNSGGNDATVNKLNYGASSFYGETVIIEENKYNGYDYTDVNANDTWVAERNLNKIVYASEHATMREDPKNSDVTLVEFKVKLDEITGPDGNFEYGFHASAMGVGDSGNDYLFFNPMVVKEVAKDISNYDRYHMPMWFWSNTCLEFNKGAMISTRLKSSYRPVTEIGAKYNIDNYNSAEYGYKNTSAIRLGAYYDHDYIRRFMRDIGIADYNEWDYWDVYEMGVLVFPSYNMRGTDADGNVIQLDHDEFLTFTADDRYDKLGAGVLNIEADKIENHLGGGSRFADYENFVFYAALVLTPAQNTGSNRNAWLNMKYSYRGYVDFYGNDKYNDVFEGCSAEMDPFLQYYYSKPELYKEGTFEKSTEENVWINGSNNGFDNDGSGFTAGTATQGSAEVCVPSADLMEKLYQSFVDAGDEDKWPADRAAQLKEFSLKNLAKYTDFYSNSMIRSINLTKEISERKEAQESGNNNGVGQIGAGVYYVPANDNLETRVEYLTGSVGYVLSDDSSESNAVVYVDGSNITVDAAISLAGGKNFVATTDSADIAAQLRAANINTVFNTDKDVLGMLGMAALVNMTYGTVSVDVDYYGTSANNDAAREVVTNMLSDMGIKFTNVGGTLNVLVLTSASDAEALLAKAEDNLAGNIPTVVIDMTEGENLSGISEAMHLARLLGFSQNPDASTAAAIALAQGVARYTFLSKCGNIENDIIDTHTYFMKSITHSLVNDIAYGVEYGKNVDDKINASTVNVSNSEADALDTPAMKENARVALKTQAFQNKAEALAKQINGSNIIKSINGLKGTTENLNACVLIGTFKAGTADESSFEIIMTSGVNVARTNYQPGSAGATYEYNNTLPYNRTWANYYGVNNLAGSLKTNLDNELTDGVITDKIWDTILPDVVTGASATRGMYTAGHWYCVPTSPLDANGNPIHGNTATRKLTLDGTYNVSAIRVHLGTMGSGNAAFYAPGVRVIIDGVSTRVESCGKDVDAAYEPTVKTELNGLLNYTYWATIDLGGVSAKEITLEFLTPSWGVMLDEVEVYTVPGEKATAAKELNVATYNVGHTSHAYSSGEKAFVNTGNNVWAWAEAEVGFKTSDKTVDLTSVASSINKVGTFINKLGRDVIFVQEVAQYVGTPNGWGNSNQIKMIAEAAGITYYTYAAGEQSNFGHGVTNVSDDALTNQDTPSVGVGILSKYPIVASGVYNQTNGQAIAWARINVNGLYIDVSSVHILTNSGNKFDLLMQREECYAGMARITENCDVFFTGGDFNERYVYHLEILAELTNWNVLRGSEGLYQSNNEKGEQNYYPDTHGVKNCALLAESKWGTLQKHKKIVDNIMYGGTKATFSGIAMNTKTPYDSTAEGYIAGSEFATPDHRAIVSYYKITPKP